MIDIILSKFGFNLHLFGVFITIIKLNGLLFR